MIDWVDLCERQLGENSCFQLQQKQLGRILGRFLCKKSPGVLGIRDVAHVSEKVGGFESPRFFVEPGHRTLNFTFLADRLMEPLNPWNTMDLNCRT